MERSWYAVMTKPNAERYAELALRGPDYGYTVYNPKVLRRVAHAGRVVLVERPFLPRYILVLADGRGSRGVRAAPGVASVVCAGDRPALMPNREVKMLRAREVVVTDRYGDKKRYIDMGDLDLRNPRKPGYKRNEIVRVTGGPFEGFNALFECGDDAMRAMVFLDLMGRKTKASIEYANLEKLNA